MKYYELSQIHITAICKASIDCSLEPLKFGGTAKRFSFIFFFFNEYTILISCIAE
jgi:hypothetical protein